ncbi:FtsX-like permease family protein [Amycolatopsis sp. H20-H5]|uniref:FtsX-like permease family protein n=1 Tax=Amycolatopsis sp. H20-H5 TaxID=3046309 RepID=UPI002DC06362|nr:ABC transporter permease [Amycolatopsis sp. H20-H5]MEC3979345.1 ABC transporter permease [Amycolatopsis sp. H20-H5]
MPWRAAPRAALSSPLTMIVAAATALLACFLGTAAVLQGSAAGSATIAYQASTSCPDSYGPVFGKSYPSPADVPAIIDTVRRHAPAQGFSAPVSARYTPVLGNTEMNGDPNYKVRLAYRDQAGLDNLGPVEGTSAPGGLLLGQVIGSAEHLGVGTKPVIRGVGLPPVVGLYRDLLDPPPRWWCSQQRGAVVDRLANDPIDSIVFTTDAKTFQDTVAALKLPKLENLHISFYEPVPRTLSDAEDLVARSNALVADVEADLARQGLAGAVTSSVPFDRSVVIAQQASENVLVSILPLAAISVLVGCAGIGTVALQWYQRRHAQLRLLCARGSGPAGLGGLAVAELGLPIVLGGAAGAVLARLLLRVYGPPGEADPRSYLLGFGVAGGVLLLSLLLLAVVVGVRAHREFELGRVRTRGKRLRLVGLYFPWELVTAAVAVVGWNRLVGYGSGSRLGNPLPQVDPIALTYPVFVVLTAGLLTARVAWVLLRLSHRARFWSRPALQLAIRRLASARAPVTGVLVIGTLAVGTLAAGLGIAGGQEDALQTKSGIFVGANSRVDTETPVGTGARPLPSALTGTSTIVGELTGTGSVVLVVDPATVRTGAELSALPREDVDNLLAKIDVPPGATVPAIRIAHGAKQTTMLGGGLPQASVVGDLPVFPLIGTKPGYVVSRTALTPAQLRIVPKWSVLSSSPLATVSEALSQAGLVQPNRISRDSALDGLPFYVVSWTFSFVALLGAVLAAVAVLALLVAVEVRRRQNALAGALVLRMGMRPRTLLASHLLELGALSAMAVITGVACGLSVAGLSVPRFDPATFLAPRSELPDPASFVFTVFGIGVLVVALAGWLAVRSVRTARTAELIRA